MYVLTLIIIQQNSRAQKDFVQAHAHTYICRYVCGFPFYCFVVFSARWKISGVCLSAWLYYCLLVLESFENRNEAESNFKQIAFATTIKPCAL